MHIPFPVRRFLPFGKYLPLHIMGLAQVFQQGFIIISRQVNCIMALVGGCGIPYPAAYYRGMYKIIVLLKVETDMVFGGRIIFKQPFGIVPPTRPGCFF